MTGAWGGDLNLDALKGKTRQGAVEGLRDAAEFVLAESNKHVPIESGTLERSGKATVDEQRLTYAVSYDTPYAVVQHESMGDHHDAGRSAKFLENAINANRSKVMELVAAAIRRKLGT